MTQIKTFIATIGVVFFTASAMAQLNVQRRDMKLASQSLLETRTVTTPILADADRVLNDQATSASAVTTVTTFLAQPDVCRNITLTTGGTTTDVAAGNVTITGTNIFGKVITEDLAVTANQAGATTGTKAFCTVTSVAIPVQDGAGANYDIGVGSKLGLHRCLAAVGNVSWATVGGAFETTRPTCTASASAVESNGCTMNTALDGTKDVVIYFVQNFACLP